MSLAHTHNDPLAHTGHTGLSLGQPCFSKASKGHASCLSIRCDDGSLFAPEFTHLIDKCYLPSKGILLFFSHCTVTILGKQFNTLYDHLNNRKVASIYPLREPFDNSAHQTTPGSDIEEKAIITSITVKYGQPDMPKRIQAFCEPEQRP